MVPLLEHQIITKYGTVSEGHRVLSLTPISCKIVLQRIGDPNVFPFIHVSLVCISCQRSNASELFPGASAIQTFFHTSMSLLSTFYTFLQRHPSSCQFRLTRWEITFAATNPSPEIPDSATNSWTFRICSISFAVSFAIQSGWQC